MMLRRVRVVEGGCNVGGDVSPVLPAIVVDGAERMQRCQRAVYEACERVELGGFTSEEVRIEVGSKSVHWGTNRTFTLQIGSQMHTLQFCGCVWLQSSLR
jgi:hypothetical protein